MTGNNMPASIGVNLRVTGHCRQGGRKYMEDFFSVAYQQTEDEKDLEYAFFGIYDGHGGAEAAAFAKEHLMETIIKHKNFWSDDDEDVLRAIKDGYIATHYAMWRVQEKWPRTASGLLSTAGTTASVAFIRRGKIYIGHVGDSGIILGYQEPGCSEWKAQPLTRDHKPDSLDEMTRITSCGGKVVSKSGVPRVVWNRPKIGHQGPVRRSTPIDEIPFLAVARSLGDLWSYNYQSNRFIVSPDPDCSVIKIDTNTHRCLIFGTDGLYNMLSSSMAVHIVQQVERHNENAALSDSTYKTWLNPSKLLVEKALERWHSTKMRADNTSVVTLMLDPPGPPRAVVLKDRKKNLPERGLKIMTRFDSDPSQDSGCSSDCDSPILQPLQADPPQTVLEIVPEPTPVLTSPLGGHNNKEERNNECLSMTTNPETTPVSSSDLNLSNSFPLKERNFLLKPRESTSFDPREPWDSGKENFKSQQAEDTIQCNEVSSSNIEVDSTCLDDEEGDGQGRSAKHNLRSAKKGRNEVLISSKAKNGDGDIKNKGTKRKMEVDQTSPQQLQPRKSMRLDNTQKKGDERVEKDRRAFEAEEKLKRLAEKADLAKRRSALVASAPAPSSSAKKIAKSKISEVKKKAVILNKPIAKKKMRLVLDRVKRVQDTVMLKTKTLRPQKSEHPVKKLKIIAKKPTFQRHSRKNVSQRHRNVTILANIVGSQKKTVLKVKPKVNFKEATKVPDLTGPEKVGKKPSNPNVQSTVLRQSSRNSLNKLIVSDSPSTSSQKEKTSPAKPETKSLKKRLQQKTESLKRNVMRRK